MIMIDDFTKPNPYQFFVVGSGMNPSKEITESSSGAIGGERDSLISVVGQAKPDSVVGIIGYDTYYTVNALQVGTNGFAPTVAQLQYSGTDLLNTTTSLVNAHGLGGGLGIDLTGGGTVDRFMLNFLSVDAQPTTGLDVAVTITSPGGKSSVGSIIVPNSMSALTSYILFSNVHGTASTSHVDSITFTFNGKNETANVDYEVQMLAAVGTAIVPEPASGTLMMIAFGILAMTACAARRRRQTKLMSALTS
jgi:hypothetical protein